ncbi:MAG: glycosyltransferase family 39 protein [Dongiaceae bacterium]
MAALIVAGWQYHLFLDQARQRWNGIINDRNAHYEFALDLALAIRHASPVDFVATLLRSKTWPPIHGLFASLILAIGGPDWRLAVLPSLVGFVMTATCAFLLARRISPASGNAAGLLAAAMVLASPAHRAFAADVMLESLGAGLTMLVFYLYVASRQDQSIRTWRWLAITLTLLFFEKYNYWTLAVIGLTVAELVDRHRELWERGREFVRAVPWRDWAQRQFRHKPNWLVLLALLVPAAIFAIRPAPLEIAGRSVGLYPPYNLTTVAFALLAGRLLLGWRSVRGEAARLLGPRFRVMLHWLAVPIAISWLLPQRLALFVAYNLPGWHPARRGSILDTASFYLGTAAADYHVGSWSAALVAVLVAAAAATVRRWRPGGLGIFMFVLIAATLNIAFSYAMSRFLHSWIALVWVTAAVGLVSAIGWRTGPAASRLAGVAALTLAALQLPAMIAPGHSPQRGHRGEATSTLDIADAYLPLAADAASLAGFGTEPAKAFFRWTYRERFRRKDRDEWVFRGDVYDAEGVRRAFAAWRQRTTADTVVFIDFPPGSPEYSGLWNYAAFAQIPGLMDADPEFRRARQWRLSALGAIVTLWTKASLPPVKTARLEGCRPQAGGAAVSPPAAANLVRTTAGRSVGTRYSSFPPGC